MLAGAGHAHLSELRADSVEGGDLVVRFLGEGGLERRLVRDEQFGGEEAGFLLLGLVEQAAVLVGEQDVVERVLQEVVTQLMGQA